MRTLIQLDLKIDKDECLALLDDYADFIKEHTGIECEFYVERKDFSQVPTHVESDGDIKPTPAFRTALMKDVHNRYRDYGTDNVVMWVHEDNFLYKGIWGQNWSYIYHKFSLQLCRWDKDNKANTFGTLYHEQMHSFDRLVLEELGIDMDKFWQTEVDEKGNPIKGTLKFNGKMSNKKKFVGYDSVWVHGNHPDADYIGRRTGRENTKALQQIAPYVLSALKKRKEKHDKDVGLLRQIVTILSTVVALLLKKNSV